MVYYYYNFVVYKTSRFWIGYDMTYPHSTIYTVKSDHLYDDKSFSFVASRLVLAERVMLFDTTQLSHVVVYEYHAGKLWDANTVTHTLLPGSRLYSENAAPIRGARTGPQQDAFMGLKWVRHSQRGKGFYGFFAGCVGKDDVFLRKIGRREISGLIMNPQGPLQTRCWPFYANQLATMPQIQDEDKIDKFGYARRNEVQTSGRKIWVISDMARVRQRRAKRLPKTFYIENVMKQARVNMLNALQTYHKDMNKFDHAWGDGHLPYADRFYWFFHDAAAVWYPLMRAFGYSVDTKSYGYLDSRYNMSWVGLSPAQTGVKWQRSGGQIDSCLNMLFQCQQQLSYLFGDRISQPGGPSFYGRWRSIPRAVNAELYQIVYDDWDNVTATFFKICDCINVLSQILLVEEAAPNRTEFGVGDPLKIPTTALQPTSYPAAVRFEAMLEVIPFEREPYLKTPPPAPPPENVPAAEDIAWDSGPASEQWDDNSEDWGQQMKVAVDTALGKLEFVRRWIGKIRRNMPWYRAYPIEKLAPKRDIAINPISEDQVPDRPFGL
jgi:hypothetical protein